MTSQTLSREIHCLRKICPIIDLNICLLIVVILLYCMYCMYNNGKSMYVCIKTLRHLRSMGTAVLQISHSPLHQGNINMLAGKWHTFCLIFDLKISVTVYAYKLSRDVNFPNPGFPQFYFCGSFIIISCASSVLRLFYKISRI